MSIFAQPQPQHNQPTTDIAQPRNSTGGLRIAGALPSRKNDFRRKLADVDRLLLESANVGALSFLDDIEAALIEAQRTASFLREELALLPPEQRRHVVPMLRARIRLSRPDLHSVLGELAGIPTHGPESS